MKNWFVRASNCSKRLTSATNRAFSVQYACGLSTTPTLLAYTDVTAHAQAPYWKGSSSHKTAMPQSVAMLHYSGCRVRGVCALQSSSCTCTPVHIIIESVDSMSRICHIHIYIIQNKNINNSERLEF